MAPAGGETLLLLLLLLLRVAPLKEMGVKVPLLLLWAKLIELPIILIPFCSELLERDLERPFLDLSWAVDFDRGRPTLGAVSAAAQRLSGGIPTSPDSLRSRSAVGEGEFDRLLVGDVRPLCFKLKSVLRKGVLEPLMLCMLLLLLLVLLSCWLSSVGEKRTGP